PLPGGSSRCVHAVTSFDRADRAGALAQQVLLDLAGGGLRDLLEPHLPRDLVPGQESPAMRDELVRRGARARLELDVSERSLTPLRVRTRAHRTGEHRRMAIERILHFERAHVLAARD